MITESDRRDEELEPNSFSSEPIVVWMQRSGSYVENIRNVVLRVKHPSKFGQNVQGISNESGELVDVRWESVMNLRPTVLELTDSRNPLPQLIGMLKRISESQVKEFLSRLKLLSLDTTDIDVHDLLFILQKLELLAAFSFSDTRFTKKGWTLLSSELARLSVRAVDMSNDILDVLDKLNVELVKLSGAPGIKVEAIKKCNASFITVRTLVAQELDYSYDGDAQHLIACIETRFPRLKTLIWDWSIVDPAVSFDNESKTVIALLAQLYKRMKLESLAIISYTPCNDTKYASGELARSLLEAGLPLVQLFRFASKGLSQGQDNFTVIIAGSNHQTRDKIHSIYVEGRTSAPDLRYLMQLLDDITPPFTSATVVEFGGIDRDNVRSAYETRKPQ
uniref:SAM domain-containing protein n=1 Tax=Haemonchus contortus TaxID=6289 RepID=A0A7I4YCW1_HAECO